MAVRREVGEDKAGQRGFAEGTSADREQWDARGIGFLEQAVR